MRPLNARACRLPWTTTAHPPLTWPGPNKLAPMESESWLGRLESRVTTEFHAFIRKHYSVFGLAPGRCDRWYLLKNAEGLKLVFLAQLATVPLLVSAFRLHIHTGAYSLGFVSLYLGLMACAYLLRSERHHIHLRLEPEAAARVVLSLRAVGLLLTGLCMLGLSGMALNWALELWGPETELWSNCMERACAGAEERLWEAQLRPPLRRADSVSKLMGWRLTARLHYGDEVELDSFRAPSSTSSSALLCLVRFPFRRSRVGPALVMSVLGLLPFAAFFLGDLLLLRIFCSGRYIPCRAVVRVGAVPARAVAVVFVNYSALIATQIEDETEYQLCLDYVRWPEIHFRDWDAFLAEGHQWVANVLSGQSNGSAG